MNHLEKEKEVHVQNAFCFLGFHSTNGGICAAQASTHRGSVASEDVHAGIAGESAVGTPWAHPPPVQVWEHSFDHHTKGQQAAQRIFSCHGPTEVVLGQVYLRDVRWICRAEARNVGTDPWSEDRSRAACHARIVASIAHHSDA